MYQSKILMKVIGIVLSILLVIQVFMPIAVYAANKETITTTKYLVNNNYIMRINHNTTAQEFLNNITINSGAKGEIYNGANIVSGTQILATGMLLKIGETSYTIIIMGDANLDGKVTATDLSLYKMHSLGITLLTGAAEQAIDINCDSQISVTDGSQLKMIIVGLPLPADEQKPVQGDIKILPDTTNLVKELGIVVYWPDEITGLIKQISINNGQTFANYTEKVTMTQNGVVIARLVNSNSQVVKSATLTVTNIDGSGPATFEMTAIHKISNYITINGTTTDELSGIGAYFFSYDNGTTWIPRAGQSTGTYVLTTAPENTTVNLKMKATDTLGNETLTNAISQRTFKKGIKILQERLQGVTINEEQETISLPDGRVFRLAVNENGGYAIRALGTESDNQNQVAEENNLNNKIAQYETKGILTVDEILTKLTEERLGVGTLLEKIFTTENVNGYIVYKIAEKEDGKHEVRFTKTLPKNGLTASGQIKEQETLDQISLIIETLKTAGTTNVSAILDKAVTDKLILEENINRNSGIFETEIGLVYSIDPINFKVDLLGLAAEVEDGYISEKMLQELEIGLKSQIIDWAIADGITTIDKASKLNGIYQTLGGQYKKVQINVEQGTYTTVDTTVESAIIEYTLTPDFPLMTNKTVLGITSIAISPIDKIEVITEIGTKLFEKTYSDSPMTVNQNIDITYNGTYVVKIYTRDGNVTSKEILISNIASILPIKVTINPETPRNTAKTGIQNGIASGPVSVTLKFSEALLLENANKYQYQIGGTTGEWTTATREQIINNITENCKIYARYFDGTKSIKQVEIVVDTVDNIAPNAFTYSTTVNSNSITVNAVAVDTASDTAGHKAREGVEGIGQYLYKLDEGEWQQDKMFYGLTQETTHKVYVRAIDYAGNETAATNNGSDIKISAVPSAQDVVSFEYSNKAVTKDNVIVTIKTTLTDSTYYVEYQPIDDNSEPVASAWVKGTQYEATGNCKVYVRIIDSTNQVAKTGGYAVGNVTNIDNQGPVAFKPKATATTKNSITINASSENGGIAIDAPASNKTACTGTEKYDYYITGTSGTTTVVKDQTTNTYTFTGLEQGSLYSVYVIATDRVGNSTTSQNTTIVTNGTLNEYANIHTTITGLKEEAAYNNPIIPAGFAPINENATEWGDGTALPTGWNDGLVIKDRDGNQFVWVPVDGKNVAYQKWLTAGMNHTATTDGVNPIVNKKEILENEQVVKYGGFYIARYEAAKDGVKPSVKTGESPWTGTRYEYAKEKAENMYNTVLVQSGLTTGTQWDTLMKWIQNANAGQITNSSSWGNFTGTKANTGSSETYRVKNIYDIAGNVQEITNEISGTDVVVRGGAYNVEKAVGERYVYSQEYANASLGFRTVLYVIESEELEPTEPGVLGIGNINPGPGNVTINGGTPSYLNPVVPVGFKAMNTTDAKWTGLPTPSGWNNGLVIEDENGNQFVWIPVNKTEVKYEKWMIAFAPSALKADKIAGDELPLALQELSIAEKAQVDMYGGFYIARYEAGNDEGMLASKSGLKTVNGVTYVEAKEYAESMYGSPYVKSGLLTGTAWDTTTKWIANSYGENQVRNNQNSGNNYNASFTFSGDYAAGPNEVKEMRGPYQTGTNVNKAVGDKMLLATGLVNNFKMKNMYDLAGNVWEYTSEYATNKQNQTEYIARGADYYRRYSTSAPWGAAIRENIDTKIAERRNEGGFRVMLYLVEGSAGLGKFADYNRTIDGKPATFKNPVIPSGFAAVNKGANWGNGTTIAPEWNNGLVIENEQQNEFVWVPVDKNDVQYKKWLTRGATYKETDGDEIPAKVVKWNEKEETQINKYGGFYIARYESSKETTATETTAVTKNNRAAWTNINYTDAKTGAEGLQTKEKVSSGLITGTQWDTVMKWIANEKGIPAVAEDSTSWGYYANSSETTGAQAKNIFLLAGGSWEWTTEAQGQNKGYRGGVKTDRGDSSPAGYRGFKEITTTDQETTFRMVLYVTGDVIGMATKPVQEAGPLPGTIFPGSVNAPELSSGMTPVKWTGSSWTITTAEDPDWYAYLDTTIEGANSSRWANAKTPDGKYWVWIPRYAMNSNNDVIFLLDDTNLACTQESLAGYSVPVAFNNSPNSGGWDKELKGFWVAKNETGGFVYKIGGAGFVAARNAGLGMSSADRGKIDVHMSKDSEWLAVAHLAYSKYGVNQSSKTPGTTTNNETGVYDMSSGLDEYVAAFGSDYLPSRYSNLADIVQAPAKYRQVASVPGGGRNPLVERKSLFVSGSKCSNSNVPNTYRMIIIK